MEISAKASRSDEKLMTRRTSILRQEIQDGVRVSKIVVQTELLKFHRVHVHSTDEWYKTRSPLPVTPLPASVTIY